MEQVVNGDRDVAAWLEQFACEPDWWDALREDLDGALARLAVGMSPDGVAVLRSLLLHGGLLEVRAPQGRPWAGWGIGC